MRVVCTVLLGLILFTMASAFALLSPASDRSDARSYQRVPCSNLTALVIPNVTISSAAEIPAGPFTLPRAKSSITVPTLCRVIGAARPATDSVINFEVWIPATEWNGKFLGVGNGGYSGAIAYSQMADAVGRGYATAGTDTGHSGDDLDFVVAHHERAIDFGNRAIHVMTEAAKLIIRDYKGNFPRHAYFRGCSTGGGQGLSEAQRFPDDYDGILVGDPGNDRTGLYTGLLWDFYAIHERSGSFVPETKLPMLNKAAVAACDALDGVTDGIISDPERCKFDPGTLLCKPGADETSCLTAPQVEAVKKIYAGPNNPRTGEHLFAGYEPGSEKPVGDPTGGWESYVVRESEPKRMEFWRYWVFDDPNWDWHHFDFDRDVAYSYRKVAFMNAVETNLSSFRDFGGKLLMYHGWVDPIGPPRASIDYFESVARTMGGRDQVDGFFRLFMVPGMAHCGNGPGPTPMGGDFEKSMAQRDPKHDLLSALDEWVDHGVPPDQIIAMHFKDVSESTIDRTRPLCPYPQIARWKGVGSTDDASNFVCVMEPGSLKKTGR